MIRAYVLSNRFHHVFLHDVAGYASHANAIFVGIPLLCILFVYLRPQSTFQRLSGFAVGAAIFLSPCFSGDRGFSTATPEELIPIGSSGLLSLLAAYAVRYRTGRYLSLSDRQLQRFNKQTFSRWETAFAICCLSLFFLSIYLLVSSASDSQLAVYARRVPKGVLGVFPPLFAAIWLTRSFDIDIKFLSSFAIAAIILLFGNFLFAFVYWGKLAYPYTIADTVGPLVPQLSSLLLFFVYLRTSDYSLFHENETCDVRFVDAIRSAAKRDHE